MRWFWIAGLIGMVLCLSGCGAPPQAPTAVQAQASAVQSVSPLPDASATGTTPPQDTATLPPTDTIAPLETNTLSPTDVQVLATPFPFVLQSDSPRYLPAFTQPEAGCAWVGIAGQVFDENRQPIDGVVVLVKGYFNGKVIDTMSLSGLGKAYGPAGFEIQIGDRSAETSNALTIQLVNDQFEALSEAYPLTTYDDCQRNLILINFQAKSDEWRLFLPAVGQ